MVIGNSQLDDRRPRYHFKHLLQDLEASNTDIRKMLDELAEHQEEVDDIRAFDEALAELDDVLPLDEALAEIDRQRGHE